MTTEGKQRLRELATNTGTVEGCEARLWIKCLDILALLDENKRLEDELKGKPPLNVQASETIPKLFDRIDKLEAALKFYAQGKLNSNDDLPEGTRLEFGCGCCAGLINAEGMSDYDSDVIGLTAREALAEDEHA